MLEVIQYLKGYVCIRVWGYSPERFMNLCSNHDIFLWNIQNHGEYYTMCITVKGFRRLKGIVRKTGTKVVIQKRCGLPFLMLRIKRRKIFLIGLIGSLLFWIWMSTFIWSIHLVGNYSVSEDIFMDFLKENKIHVGMKRDDVNIEELEKKIRQDFPIVTWTSAKIDGTSLEIQIKENEVDTKASDSEQNGKAAQQNTYGSNLVAGADGTIVSMITRKGVPQTEVGMEVKKGDILVLGNVPVYNEDTTIKKYQYYEADADVYISRTICMTEELPMTYQQKVYTGEEKKEMLFGVMAKDFYLGLGKVHYEHYDKVTDKRQVKLLDNFYLPIYYGSRVNREYTVTDNRYSKEEVETIFSEKLRKFVGSLEEKGVQIMKKNVTIKKNQKNWLMNIEMQIVEKTGTNIPITIQENPVEESPEGVN